MKETFRKRLENYGEVAKDQIGNDFNLDKELETVLKWQITKGAESSKTGEKTQVDIYGIQLEKQAIMEKLKRDISDLDKKEPNEEIKKGKKIVSKDGRFIIEEIDKEITVGELLTDGEWGLDYSLQTDSVPRNLRKKYLIESTKIKLQRLLDDQIAMNEKDSEEVHHMKREAYRKSFEEKESEKAGLLAEKMIRNLLKKVSIDLGGDFEINKADLYQDVNQKVDFIIRRNVKERGVKIEENKKSTGIQFTINVKEDVIKHKKEQVEKANRELTSADNISDIVLVSVPIKEINSVYTEWKKDKKSGGPDKLWAVEEKQRIFSEIMKDFLSPEEIKEYSKKIK